MQTWGGGAAGGRRHGGWAGVVVFRAGTENDTLLPMTMDRAGTGKRYTMTMMDDDSSWRSKVIVRKP